MRGVADTNTIVSALLWGGAPAEILAAAREQRITLFTSAALIAELEEVLAREKFATRIARVSSTVADLVAGYRDLVQLVRVTDISPVSRDPDDDQVIACAVAAEADLIVTRDKDLLTLDPFRTVRIFAARDTLALLTKSPS